MAKIMREYKVLKFITTGMISFRDPTQFRVYVPNERTIIIVFLNLFLFDCIVLQLIFFSFQFG